MAHQSLAGSQASSTFIIRGLVKKCGISVPCLSIPTKPESTFSQDPQRIPALIIVSEALLSRDLKQNLDAMGMNSQEGQLHRHLQITKHLTLEPWEPPPCPILSRTMT